ncbi:Lrp/AsnC family transcriptional regulator [Methylobrevis pamukkalensis]|uniref:Leucine-responsive regulatory protein n=1 Tax=Methylobrevis pamukkalensis TaxID=1439726 RepID=A0A1E3GZD5_9HYPH|nr:Lrp/AsnC family transcriptional regulator [Methylobrevis pamukkalensis]ODN69392.1 Leucine-responsive regulatory protein [Methylobrevis pamukkalensis]
MADLDSVDRQLVDLLQRQGQTSYSDLAKAVGLAVSSVTERVRKLSERGVLLGVHGQAAPEALGLDLLAFVFVSWSDPAVADAFLTRIGAEPAVQEAHHVTGQWNYLLKVRVTTTRMLEAFLTNVIKGVPGIERTETLIVLSSAKETTYLPVVAPAWYG